MADTALTIIEAAAKHLGVLETGASLTGAESQDGLRALSGMMGVWAIDGLPMYGETLTTHTLVAATASYTIGPSGADITAARPTGLSGIQGAWVRDSGNADRRIRKLWSYKRYQDIRVKTTQGPYADVLAIDPGVATSTIYLYPTPSAGNTLRLLYEALISFTALSDSFSLPPGSQEAIEYNLALRLAPSYGMKASPDLRHLASEAKKAIERVNAAARIGARKTDVPRMPGTGGGYEITSDEWN